jgi:hypothetical protein
VDVSLVIFALASLAVIFSGRAGTVKAFCRYIISTSPGGDQPVNNKPVIECYGVECAPFAVLQQVIVFTRRDNLIICTRYEPDTREGIQQKHFYLLLSEHTYLIKPEIIGS